MDLTDYLAAVEQDPWHFPTPAGFPDPPAEWAAAAWDTPAVQDTVADDMAEDVSKMGEIWCHPGHLEGLSAVLGTEQVFRLYEKIRDRSPHREDEFREQFERAFARHAAALRPPFTRDEIAARFGCSIRNDPEFMDRLMSGDDADGPD